MRQRLKSLNQLLVYLADWFFALTPKTIDLPVPARSTEPGESAMNFHRTIKPRDVDSYHTLKQFAQQLCHESNNVDGIIIICPSADDPIFLDTCAKENFQGIDIAALASSILKVIEFSEDLVISHEDFNPGEIKSIVYEFNKLAFVIYNILSDAANAWYMIFVNSKDKDLGAFNANRPRIRAQMEVALRREQAAKAAKVAQARVEELMLLENTSGDGI